MKTGRRERISNLCVTCLALSLIETSVPRVAFWLVPALHSPPHGCLAAASRRAVNEAQSTSPVLHLRMCHASLVFTAVDTSDCSCECSSSNNGKFDFIFAIRSF